MSVQDMRAELKLLRQEHPDHQPVSKMKKADISSLLEKMKQKTEITPAVAMTKGDKAEPKEKPAKGEIKKAMSAEAKESKVTPLKAVKESKEKAKAEPKDAKADAPKKKESISERMARIREMRKKD